MSSTQPVYSRVGGIAPQRKRRRNNEGGNNSSSTSAVRRPTFGEVTGTQPAAEESAVAEFRRTTTLSSEADDLVDSWLCSYRSAGSTDAAAASDEVERRHLKYDPELFKPRPQR
jgi:hypothetical protein